MRSLRRSVAVLAITATTGPSLAAVVACGARRPAFRPAGRLPGQAASGPASLLPRNGGQPAGGTAVDFQTPLPVRSLQRAVVLGYESFARSQWGRRGARGPVRYFDTVVTGVYFGDGAAVASCLAVAGRRFLQEAAEGRRADGAWIVTHVDTYPATTRQGAACQ